jgi:hypothetical protein
MNKNNLRHIQNNVVRRNNNLKNKRKKQLVQNKQQLAIPKPMSILGETINRAIDVTVDINAVNSLGGAFYSFGTGLGSPVMSVNVTDKMILQYIEYSDLAHIYGLAKMKKIQIQFTRSSNAIATSTYLENTPSFFLQCGTLPNLTGTTSLMQKVAQADNSIEVDVQTFSPRAWDISLPPSIVSINRAHNDVYPFGSQVWVSTRLNTSQHFPDLYLNLGAFSQPTFSSTTPSSVVLIGQLHVRFQMSFAAPIIE